MNHNPAVGGPMRLLVVEDSPTQALLLRQRLVRAGFDVRVAADGNAALAEIERQMPNLILTDLDIPGMNGLELVREVRRRRLPVPAVLLTALGSEDVAVEALKAGAAAYIPKKRMEHELGRVLDQVLAVCRASQHEQQLAEALAACECRFELPSDPALAGPLVRRLQHELVRMRMTDPATLRQVGMALHEALLNAIEHGNLEVPSELKEQGDRFRQLVEERRRAEPFASRRVRLTASHVFQPAQHVAGSTANPATECAVRYVVADEGPGFDPSTLPDPTDPANLDKPSGRGLLLIHAFMDEVSFNSSGNQITLVKRMATA